MNKLDILIRKINAQYDEEFLLENIVPTEDEFNEMAARVRASIRFPFSDEEFTAARDQVRERREASIGIIVSVDKPTEEHDLEWFSKFKEEHPDENKYHRRFELYMQEEKHWPEESVKELDDNYYGEKYMPKRHVVVIKKDGSYEEFNVQKVVNAVGKSAYRALTKFSEEENPKHIITYGLSLQEIN